MGRLFVGCSRSERAESHRDEVRGPGLTVHKLLLHCKGDWYRFRGGA